MIYCKKLRLFNKMIICYWYQIIYSIINSVYSLIILINYCWFSSIYSLILTPGESLYHNLNL